MMFLIKTNFFHEFSWFWDFQNKKQKQTPSRENQKKLGEKKEKHLLKQKILFQVEKLFFGFTSFFFGFFVSSGGCLVFWFWKSKKTRKLMEKVRIISLMFFLVFQNVLVWQTKKMEKKCFWSQDMSSHKKKTVREMILFDEKPTFPWLYWCLDFQNKKQTPFQGNKKILRQNPKNNFSIWNHQFCFKRCFFGFLLLLQSLL